MTKNILVLFLAASLSSCFGKQSQLKTGLEGKPMPSFDLLLTDSTTMLNTSKIPSGEPIVLFYFSPNCTYCKAQTEDIMSKLETMSGIRFYFFSSFPLTNIRQYAIHYQLQRHQNVVVGKDVDNYFSNYYNTPGVPYTAIYGKDKYLKRAIIGKVGINLIRDIAFE